MLQVCWHGLPPSSDLKSHRYMSVHMSIHMHMHMPILSAHMSIHMSDVLEVLATLVVVV